MNDKASRSNERQTQREVAAQRLTPGGKRDIAKMSTDRLAALLYELETHRIELEMQNEELREVQCDLTEARDQYAEIYDHSPVGFLTMNNHNLILEANLTVAEMIGLPRAQLKLQPLSSFIVARDQDVYYQHRRRVLGTGNRQRCELRLREAAGGEGRWVQLDSVGIAHPGEENDQISSVVSDISERKSVEREEVEIKNMDSFGELATGLATSYTDILTDLAGSLERAKMNLSLNHTAYTHILDGMQAMERASKLTRDLLSFPQGGQPVLEPINVTEVLRYAVELGSYSGRIDAQFTLSDELWTVRANQQQLVQVIANITKNAVQAMPAGGRLFVDASNEVGLELPDGARREGPFVKIRLRDQGVGMGEATLGKIFEPFFSTKITGAGLGLSVAQSIMHKHGGAIQVDSAPDLGTTVTVILPAVEPVLDARADLSRPSNTAPLRILVMDEDKRIRTVYSVMVKRCGYYADFVADGREAIAKYAAALKSGRPYDIVIIDLTVSEGLGANETINELLALDANARVIVASGFSTDSEIARYHEYGFKGKLAKPFVLDELRDEVQRVFGL